MIHITMCMLGATDIMVHGPVKYHETSGWSPAMDTQNGKRNRILHGFESIWNGELGKCVDKWMHGR